MPELISIIIPFFNVEDFLEECLKSITVQTYKNIEIILINDGSTDNSLEIANKFKEKDKRIKIYTTKNQGVAMARNFGIEKAKGDFFIFIDSDDFIDVDYVEYLVNLKNKYKSKITCVELKTFKNNLNKENKEEKIIVYKSKEAQKKLLLTTLSSSVSAKLLDKSLFINNKFKDYLISEDFELMFRILQETDFIVCSSLKKYFYRQRPGSIMHSKYCDKNNAVFDLLDNCELICDNSLKKEFAYYKTSMLQDHYKMLVYSNYINKNLIWTNKQNLKKIIRTKYKNALKDNPQYYMTLRQKILGKLIFTPEPIYKIVVSFIRFVKKVISWK